MQDFHPTNTNINSAKTIKSITFYSFSNGDALSNLRFIGPLSLYDIEIIYGVENGITNTEKVRDGDLVVIQRDFPQDYLSYKMIIKIAHEEKIPVVLDIDDLLLELPENHPDRMQNIFGYSLLPLLQAVIEVDLVTVSTNKLKEYMLQYNKNVIVLPNLLDERMWGLRKPLSDFKIDSPIIIGYMGGHSHEPDLLSVEPALLEILDKYKEKVQIHFWGVKPSRLLGNYENVIFKNEELWSYIDFSTYFQSQYADIFIAPLENNLFNQCKSSVKFLEYSALGVPGIYSDIEPYSKIIYPNQNGLLANSTNEWVDSLVELIENIEFRKNIALNAQDTVRSNWLLSEKAYLWIDAYKEAILNYSLIQRPVNNQFDMIEFMSSQIYAVKEKEEALINQLQEINNSKIDLENNINKVNKKIEENKKIYEEKINKSLKELSDLDRKFNDVKERYSNKEIEFAEINIQLSQKQAFLNEIENSLGYKSLMRYRRFIEKLFPRNSRQRRYYEISINGMKTLFYQGPKIFIGRISLFIKNRSKLKNHKLNNGNIQIEHNKQYPAVKEVNQFVEVYRNYISSSIKMENNTYVPFKKKERFKENDLLKLIAFYLPQYHPIPENDNWWGKGFTEWTNVSKAVPQFVNHYQPHLPDELGFYDLRVPEVQERQVELAQNYGIFGFCFYYYWFNGKRLLEKPLDIFINNDKIDFPFCLCWANENWTRRWDGQENDILIAQHYSVKSDLDFIKDIKPYLEHKNYIRINNQPIIIVYRADQLPNPKETAKLWKQFGQESGIGEPYLIAAQTFGFFKDPRTIGFDAAVEFPPHYDISYPIGEITKTVEVLNEDFEGIVYDFNDLINAFDPRRKTSSFPLYKTVLPGWDNSPRKPGKGHSYINSSPEKYNYWLRKAIDFTIKKDNLEEQIVFINAWNEWGEGAYLEPDKKYGYAFLDSTLEVLESINKNQDTERIIFYGHDAFRAGSQIVLLNLLSWFNQYTNLDIRVVLGEGGDLFDDYSSLFPTLILSELRNKFGKVEMISLLKTFLGENVKLIYANTAVAGKDLPELLNIVCAPVITHIHELEKSIKKFAGEKIFLNTKKCTTHFIAVSEPVRENLIKNHDIENDIISLINPFISLKNKDFSENKSKDEMGLEKNARIIFGCGTLDWRKGPDLFLDTARIVILELNLDCHFFWIGGNTNQVLEYKEKAKKLKLDKFTHFIGEQKDPREYFAQGDIFYLPSREDPYPLVCLEAAEFKLPIICFEKAGGIPDFVGDDCGYVVPFEDVNTAARKIKSLLENDSTRNRFGENARSKLINYHTDDVSAPQILSIIRNISGIKPKISIILPTYNHSDFLPSRLESIFNQTFRDYELIILDDNSNDKTREILEKYNFRLDIKIVFNTSNSGSTFTQWAKGFQLSNSELIWITEDDDYCEPDFLEMLLPRFTDPKIKLAYTNSHIINEFGDIIGDYIFTDYLKSLSLSKWKTDYQISAEQEINDGLGVKNTVLNISSAIFRKPDFDITIIEELRNMRLAGDWYFIVNLIKEGEICYLSKKLNYHRRHSQSVIADMIENKKMKEFFSEIALVHESIITLYGISEKFKDMWELYLRSQWNDFFPGKNFEEINDYYPFLRISRLLENKNRINKIQL